MRAGETKAVRKGRLGLDRRAKGQRALRGTSKPTPKGAAGEGGELKSQRSRYYAESKCPSAGVESEMGRIVEGVGI